MKIFILLLINLLLSFSIFAQVPTYNTAKPTTDIPSSKKQLKNHVRGEAEKEANQWLSKLKEKLQIDFNLSTNFGDVNVVDFSPALTYEFNNVLSIGGGPSVQYSYQENGSNNTVNYGGRVYVRSSFKEYLPFLQIEAERINGKISLEKEKTTWNYAAFVGAGYNLNFGSKTGLQLSVLRNVTFQEGNSLYSSPWVVRMNTSLDLKKSQVNQPNVSKPSTGDFPFDLGGVFWVNFGDYPQVDFSPILSYPINDLFQVGFGPSYQFKKSEQTKNFQSSYGGRVYGRYIPRKQQLFFAQIEAESINSSEIDVLDQETINRKWFSAGFIGGGLNFPIGNRSLFNVTALRNVTWNKQTPIHSSPWVLRVGFQI